MLYAHLNNFLNNSYALIFFLISDGSSLYANFRLLVTRSAAVCGKRILWKHQEAVINFSRTTQLVSRWSNKRWKYSRFGSFFTWRKKDQNELYKNRDKYLVQSWESVRWLHPHFSRIYYQQNYVPELIYGPWVLGDVNSPRVSAFKIVIASSWLSPGRAITSSTLVTCAFARSSNMTTNIWLLLNDQYFQDVYREFKSHLLTPKGWPTNGSLWHGFLKYPREKGW